MKNTILLFVIASLLFSCGGSKQDAKKKTADSLYEADRIYREGVPTSLQKNMWNDFAGLIGTSKAQMSLFCKDNSVEGDYLLVDKGTRIRVSGQKNKDSLILTETTDGKITGYFKGVYKTFDKDKFVGKWFSADNSKQIPFKLMLTTMVANRDSILEKETFAKKIIDCFSKKDKLALSKMVKYPITIEKNAIENEREFVKLFDQLFNTGYCQRVSQSSPYYLFEKENACMLGEQGEIWFKENKIITFNTVEPLAF